MNETRAVREHIVDFLRREIVGPSPGYPAVQINGEEILRPQDPPRQRYGAGILFPGRARLFSQEESGPAEDAEGDAASPDADEILDDTETIGIEGVDGTREIPPETESEVTLANEFLPSAMGISALVELSDLLRVEVKAASYDHEELQWETRRDRDGRQYFPKAWWRRPISCQLNLTAEELLGDRTVTLRKPLLEDEGNATLILHVVSRPYAGSAKPDRTRLVTLTLVNCRTSGNRAPANQECFFQCGFSVSSANGEANFIPYPERLGADEDSEELSLQLLYMHRRTFAVGHGCAAGWDSPTDGRVTRIRPRCCRRTS